MATVAWKKDAVLAVDAGLKWVVDGFPPIEDADHVDADGCMYKRYGQAVLRCRMKHDGVWYIALLSGRHWCSRKGTKECSKMNTKDFTEKQKEFYDSILPIHMSFGPPDLD